jgi:galactokinase
VILSGPMTDLLRRVYGPDPTVIDGHARRWHALVKTFHRHFSVEQIRFFSTPGRTEIGGNHTDHNHGKVLAAAVDLDSIAVAAISGDDRIILHSEGYERPFLVSIDSLDPAEDEKGTTTALIRGIAARFRQLGHNIGGFRACIASDVPIGSGLSSSASIEVLIATILNALFNDGNVDGIRIATICQHAENAYFGKPCGLMDQIACAAGGIVWIDFKDPEFPKVEKLEFDFSQSGYDLLVVDTGGSHSDLTEDYAAIPGEMKRVAGYFGRDFCRQIAEEDILGNLPGLRAHVGDRAILRALHFLRENLRVDLQADALRKSDIECFLRLVGESGISSYRWLQNCISPHTGSEQGIPLALALAEDFVEKWGGACRVHGGGFAGTILAFIPRESAGGFRVLMESVFGPGTVSSLHVRSQGGIEIK